MKNRRPIVLALATLAAVLAHATSALGGGLALPDITVTPKPVGSGARALGQSAFIAVADDATAASWNPAGLIQLERPEFSFVAARLKSIYDFDSHDPDVMIGSESWSDSEVNFASVTFPFNLWGRNIVASLNYHQVYDFGLEASFGMIGRGVAGSVIPMKINVEAEGAVAATSLAFGFAVTPSLSLGMAANRYGDRIGHSTSWEVTTEATGKGMVRGVLPVRFDYEATEEFDDFEAMNYTLGLLWDLWEREGQRLTVGVVYHTPYTASVDVTTRIRTVTTVPGVTTTEEYVTEEDLDIDFPCSLGAGLNFRFSDAWSMACDVQWTDWSEFEQEGESGERASPIGGGPTGELDDTIAVRLGTERLFFLRDSVVALRAGVFRDPRPAVGDPMVIYGYSLGTGLSTGRFSIDFAYQFRHGQDVSSRNLGLLDGASFSVDEHWFISSIILYF